MDNIIFGSWESSIRTIILTVLGYVMIVVILRISGKRTLSKMNAFDFVVTVALGSCLASISLNKDITLTDGVLSFSLFILLQFIFTFLSVRVEGFRTLITSNPVVVFYKGNMLLKEMKKQRITKQELLNACRLNGYSNLDNVFLIVLESTGDISVIENNSEGSITTFMDIEKRPGSPV